jgi:SAM-dependent methyltransferase
MDVPKESWADGYESFYSEFDSPLMRQIRREAYGEDIGQNSWADADEVRADIRRLELLPSSRFLDLGCGPCGILTFVLTTVGCRGTGVEFSPSALEAGRIRAASLGVSPLLTVQVGDLNEPLPFAPASFDAVMSVDVVLHLRDRLKLLREVMKVLAPGGRFLFTDAGVVTGSISNEDIRKRSARGYTQFVPVGWNERLLASAGFRLVETEDRTASVVKHAAERLAAMRRHQTELERLSSAPAFEKQQDYLETAAALYRSGALSRVMYLADVHAAV